MGFGVIGLQAQAAAVGLDGLAEAAASPFDQPQTAPPQRQFGCRLGGAACQGSGVLEVAVLQQQGGQVEAGRQGQPWGQRQLQGLAVQRLSCTAVVGQCQVQQQLVALGVGLARALCQPLAQQGEAALALALADLEGPQLGGGVGIAGTLGQLGLHRRPQPPGLLAAGQQFGAVAVMQQGRHRAVGDPPVGFPLQQSPDAVVDHGVVAAAPADLRVASKQAAHIGVRGLRRPKFMAQQVDQQQVGIGHQLPQRLSGLVAEHLIGIEHQHPVAADVFQGRVAGRAEVARPGHVVHHGPAALGNGRGVVTGSRVDQHHLVDESPHRGQAALQSLGFVAHDHREAEHRGQKFSR